MIRNNYTNWVYNTKSYNRSVHYFYKTYLQHAHRQIIIMTIELVDDVSGFDSVQAADTIDALLSQHGGRLEVHNLVGLYPGVKNMLAGRRVVTFLQESTSRFDVIQMGTENTVIVVSKQSKDVSNFRMLKTAMVISGAENYERDLCASLINGIVFYTSKNTTEEYTPIKWLYAHRSIPKFLKGWSQTHPNPEWLYQHKPNFGGYVDVNAAKLASQSAYLHHFLGINDSVFQFNDTKKAVSLCKTETSTKLINNLLEKFNGKKTSAKKTKVETTDSNCSLPAVDVSNVAAGDVVIVGRVSSRSRGLNTSELQLYSEWCNNHSETTENCLQLSEIKCGLVLVSGGSTSARKMWNNNIESLTSVRRQLTLLAISNTRSGFRRLIPSAIASLPNDQTYHLNYETYYPEVDPSTLPFHDMSSDASIISLILSNLKDRYSPDCDDNSSELFVVSSSDCFLLGCVSGFGSKKIQKFVNSWEKRPFIFSGAMEGWIAASVVSVALLSHAIINKTNNLIPDMVLDACCGSGTLAAASSVLGVKNVVGFEIRDTFVSRIQENLDHCSISSVCIFHKDSSDKLNLNSQPNLIICNAPWGKKFGTEKDCVNIVSNIITSCPKSTMAFVIPKQVIQSIVSSGVNITIHKVVPLGVVNLFIITVDE